MKKLQILIILMATLLSCQKAQKMKKNLIPDRNYENAMVDKFYWADSDNEFKCLPLNYPYKLIMSNENNQNWTLDSKLKGKRFVFDNNVVTHISSVEPIVNFNLNQNFIYGERGISKDSEIPKYWFLFDISQKNLEIYLNKTIFLSELKKLTLPETFLKPDEIYEQFKEDPVLPWFPQEIKKQLEEVKDSSQK